MPLCLLFYSGDLIHYNLLDALKRQNEKERFACLPCGCSLQDIHWSCHDKSVKGNIDAAIQAQDQPDV
ncbi:hypothetical protein V6Z11_A11G112500 [Gossypium hirsutum]